MPRPSRDHAISSVRLKGIGASDGDNAFQKRLADEACLLRGKIIAGYSLVEYVLADISVRLDLKFPYRTKDRGPPARSTASCASCSRSTSTHRRGARALRNTATDSLREFVDAGIGERRFLLAVFLIPPGRPPCARDVVRGTLERIGRGHASGGGGAESVPGVRSCRQGSSAPAPAAPTRRGKFSTVLGSITTRS
jgi:hypothetical protein